MKHISQFSPFDRPRKDSPWVLLYSAEQGAYHIETRDEYDSKPANGYHLLEVTRTYEEAAEKLREYCHV